MGTNSNINGLYTLKLPAGNYEIVYQYVGYSKKTEKVELNADKVLNITLNDDAVSLKEVEIKAGEDPAYAIIRQAIRKRKYYLNQASAYTCKAYIKGLQRINKLPKNMAKLVKISGGDASDTADMKGVVYLSESESKYHYRKPDDEKEIMFSSKVSGNNKAFSFNQLSDMKLNFYNNLVEISDLSDRPFTSPIHENAFLFYKFYLLGTINGEGKLINKIKVVPKRKTDPCFRGIIYIQDSTWRITSVDLMLTKDAKIDFVDTVLIKELYAPVFGDSLWMPVTMNFNFDFKAFGFKGNGYFNANIKEYDMNPTYPKKFFKNEVLKVEDSANKKDTSYWTANRPVPLTAEEIKDYRQKDSIEKARSSDRYKDSVDKKRNRFKFENIFTGYTYTKTKKRLSVSLPGLITNGVQYNTVEGLNLSYKFGIDKSYEDYRFLSISGNSRYGFANKLWGGELGASYLFKPEKFSRWGINLKSIVEQFNQADPISPLVNSLYTLFYNENHMKLFKETSAQIYYSTELVNGVFFNPSIKYAERDPLKNSTDLLIIDDKHKIFTSNDPQHPNTNDSSFSSNNALIIDVNFTFRFKQKYYTLPHQKIISGSKYPRLNVGYKKALPYLNTVSDFDLVNAMVSDNIKLGLFGHFNYRLSGGYFLNTNRLYFTDYKHFMGNQTIFNTNNPLYCFRLLPYYTYSADKWYAEAHAEHHFGGFIANKIPLIRKYKVLEVAGVHAMASNRVDYYYELNFGLEKLFKVIRVDYVLGYMSNAKLRQGFTVAIKADF
jgi:hypothetical protein